MDSTLYNSKFLITLLSSSNSKLLKLSYQSIINQLHHYMNYTIVIVVNSLNTEYYKEVSDTFKELNVEIEIIETQSNGKPGMGHNSLFEVFKNKKQYDYLIPIDGDDFLYPYALHQLSKIIIQHTPDILVLQGNDVLSWYEDAISSTDIFLNNSFYLIKQDEYPVNKWNFNKDIVNKNPFTSETFITPVRLILCSRNIFKLNIIKYYCDNCNVIDDYLFYLHFINIYIKDLLKVYIINSNHIYLYNDLSILSVHNTLSLTNDYKYIKKYKDQFNSVIDYFKEDWDVLKLPFININPPFSDIYNKYKIYNETIQILNYDKYIQNINTVYCVDFCKNLVVEIYNIFKNNIDTWLANNNIKKALELCLKFIKNNCSDREIYTYICICGVFINDEKLIYKYINDALPYCKNYDCLLKYIK